MLYQLKENKTNRGPVQHIVLQAVADSEQSIDDPGILRERFRAVAACRFRLESGRITRRQDVYYEDLSSWWEWLYSQVESAKLATWIWCDDLVWHAGVLHLWSELERERMRYETSALSAKCSYIRCRPGGKVIWLDRCNWFRVSMAELFSSTNNWREEITDNYVAGVDGEVSSRSIVMGLRTAVYQLCTWVRAQDLGCLSLTVAGQALQAYRHRFGPRRTFSHTPRSGKNAGKKVWKTRVYPIRHEHPDALKLERDAYYGGPTHVYYVGKVKTPVTVLDVRSLYPWCMLQYQVPCRLKGVSDDMPVPELAAILESWGAIARVQIQSEEVPYPVRRKSGVYYVTGRFDTSLAGPELEQALELGHVAKVYSCAWYELRDLFSNFVRWFWTEKTRYEKEGKKAWAEVLKSMAVCLPGKFGQRKIEWQDDGEFAREPWGYYHTPDPLSPGSSCLARGIASQEQLNRKDVDSVHCFRAIPAYVCSTARVRMRELIDFSRRRGRVYYSATDSIHCDVEVARYLRGAALIGDGLGQLQVKGTWPTAEYRGIGDYTLGREVTRIGLPESAVLGCPFCRAPLPAGAFQCPQCHQPWDKKTYWYLAHECAAEVIGHGPKDGILSRGILLQLESGYNFGVIREDGWVTPLHESPATVSG